MTYLFDDKVHHLGLSTACTVNRAVNGWTHLSREVSLLREHGCEWGRHELTGIDGRAFDSIVKMF